MEKKNPIIQIIALSSLLFLASCGGIESDAKKAAKLTNKSIEQTLDMELEKAEKSYQKAREIIEKYNGHNQSEKFNELYRKYRDEHKIPPKTD